MVRLGPRIRGSYKVMVLAALLGLAIGLACIAGLIPLAACALFLAVTVCTAVFKGLYQRLILVGMFLLPCVFVEPAPADAILLAAIPLGLITGALKPDAPGKARNTILVFIAYFIACVPGMTFAPDIGASIRYLLITLYLCLLAIFICLYASRDNINALLRAYVIAAFLSLLAGLAGKLGLFPDLLMADVFRVKGLFKDPNVFGPFFIPAIVILFDDIKKKAVLKAPAPVHFVAIAAMSLGVVFSFSRAAWINLAVAVLVYLALNIKTIRMIKLLGIAAMVIAAAVAVIGLFDIQAGSVTGNLGFLEDRARIQVYDANRFAAQRGGIELAVRNPLGYGAGQFENVIATVTQESLSAHSLYIRIAAENGIAGFLLFFAALAGMLILLYRNHRAERASRGYRPAGLSPSVVIAVLAGILVNSLVIDTLHWRHFWIFIGLGLYILKDSWKEADKHG